MDDATIPDRLHLSDRYKAWRPVAVQFTLGRLNGQVGVREEVVRRRGKLMLPNVSRSSSLLPAVISLRSRSDPRRSPLFVLIRAQRHGLSQSVVGLEFNRQARLNANSLVIRQLFTDRPSLQLDIQVFNDKQRGQT